MKPETQRQRNPLRLAEDRVLVEQLRLLLGNVGSSVIPAIMVAILLAWVLSASSDPQALTVWCAAVILSKLYSVYHAQRTLASGISFDRAPRLVWALMALNILDGAAWGALAWVTLDTSPVAASILVIAVLSGIAGSSMSLLAPVLPVFIAFIASEFLILAFSIWRLGDPAYSALVLTGVLYIASLTLQARNSAIAVRASINLRFENLDLLTRLRQETMKAQAAQREAVQATLAKSRFLAAASHDLRQPIHAQGLFLEVLSGTQLTAQQLGLLANVRAASDASADMLNTLLDFSRIEAGVIEPQVQAFHFQPLLNKIEREFVQQADVKGLAYRSRETDLVAQSDAALVELILRNLVSNAIRYTDRGGLLVVCRQRGSEVVLEVWDTGMGIEPSQQREVFREFHQLGNPERDRRKGLGLGLAIVDGLARTLGHRLTLDSRLHCGSVFRLSMPLATAPSPVTPAVVVGQTQMLNVRVLVIDDEESVRTGMLHLLRDWGCQCEAAESIEEALALAQQQAPDVIISDYRLRERRTGVEAIAALRHLTGHALPALLITGDTAPDRLREALASGIPLLHKPVSPSQLYRGLVTVLPN